jgi:hypothetical protein
MLRWMVTFLIVLAAIEPALAADESPSLARQRRLAGKLLAGKLPEGLPRPHYKFRTTVTHDARHHARHLSRLHYARPIPAEETPELLFTPTDGSIPYIPPLIHGPLLPGSSTLPGYYGSSYSYDYPGPYYGGRGLGLWNRLPYACGVYGYC